MFALTDLQQSPPVSQSQGSQRSRHKSLQPVLSRFASVLVQSEDVIKRYPTAKHVYISYKLMSLSEIDSLTCTYGCDVKVVYQWVDQSLVAQKKGRLDYGKFPNAFNPDIVVVNKVDLQEVSNIVKITDANGTVKRSVRLKGKCSIADLNLHMFPFDAQVLQLQFRPATSECYDIILLPNRKDSTIDAHRQYEWKFLSHCMKEYVFTDHCDRDFSMLHINALVQREGNWFVNNVAVVAFWLVITALTGYAMAPTAQQQRFDVGLLTVLASIENKFIVAESLPKIPYRTLIDYYLDISFLIHCGVLFGNVMVLEFTDDPMWGMFGVRLNETLFYCLIGVYLSFHVWIIIVLYEHHLDVAEWKKESDMTGAKYSNSRRRDSYFTGGGGGGGNGIKLSKMTSSKMNLSENANVDVSVSVKTTTTGKPGIAAVLSGDTEPTATVPALAPVGEAYKSPFASESVAAHSNEQHHKEHHEHHEHHEHAHGHEHPHTHAHTLL